MESKSNTLNRGFNKAYNLLPAGVQTSVREKISKGCDWGANSTFYNKKDGRFPVKRLEMLFIEKVFSEHNIDVYTGEYLKQHESVN